MLFHVDHCPYGASNVNLLLKGQVLLILWKKMTSASETESKKTQDLTLEVGCGGIGYLRCLRSIW